MSTILHAQCPYGAKVKVVVVGKANVTLLFQGAIVPDHLPFPTVWAPGPCPLYLPSQHVSVPSSFSARYAQSISLHCFAILDESEGGQNAGESRVLCCTRRSRRRYSASHPSKWLGQQRWRLGWVWSPGTSSGVEICITSRKISMSIAVGPASPALDDRNSLDGRRVI